MLSSKPKKAMLFWCAIVDRNSKLAWKNIWKQDSQKSDYPNSIIRFLSKKALCSKLKMYLKWNGVILYLNATPKYFQPYILWNLERHKSTKTAYISWTGLMPCQKPLLPIHCCRALISLFNLYTLGTKIFSMGGLFVNVSSVVKGVFSKPSGNCIVAPILFLLS